MRGVGCFYHQPARAVFNRQSFIDKNMGFIQYLNETKAELKHVSWPTRTQAVRFTVAVIIISIVTAYFLGVFDFLFTKVLDLSILKMK